MFSACRGTVIFPATQAGNAQHVCPMHYAIRVAHSHKFCPVRAMGAGRKKSGRANGGSSRPNCPVTAGPHRQHHRALSISWPTGTGGRRRKKAVLVRALAQRHNTPLAIANAGARLASIDGPSSVRRQAKANPGCLDARSIVGVQVFNKKQLGFGWVIQAHR